ncbi:hypothetical protein [Paraburkholderia flava]|uniref:hypothetical protein n=1 Tax=Paraburkholderia flava TaxID=2547393 RepID=UPI00105E8D87|nr:hypothetical protein [Paraburkholderia flava]
MRVNIEHTRRRVRAILTGRDDRLIVLLTCAAPRLIHAEPARRLRELAGRYEDELEILVHVPDLLDHAHTDTDIPLCRCRAYKTLRYLQRTGLPAVVGHGVRHDAHRRHADLIALACWTTTRDAASTAQGPAYRAPGMLVPASTALRWNGTEAIASQAGIVVDLTAAACGTEGSDSALDTVRSIANAALYGELPMVGASLDGRFAEADGASDALGHTHWNIDAAEAALDMLSNAVFMRRIATATRGGGAGLRRL